MRRARGESQRSARRRRSWIIQAIALVVAIGVGLLILGKRVGAQPAHGGGAAAPPAPPSSGAAPAPKVPKPRGVKAKEEAAAKAAAEAAAAEEAAKEAAKKDAGAGDAGDPLDYAVIQSEDDIPKDLSDEEKAALGAGKVPIHRDGPYRSAFAHPRFGGPAQAKVGLVIKEIREFNIQTGGFEADFFLSLTADKDLPALNLTFNNGHEVNLAPLADAPTFKLYAVSGKFTTEIDLRKYPFDEQLLDITMEDARAGVDQIIFEADKERTSLDSSFKVASFGVASVGAMTYKHKYPPRFDRDDLYVSRYKFTLGIDRFATSAAFSVFVPAFIIVLISLTGMWVPPGELEVRSNAGAPMLAAAVLFHYSLIQALPATGYLTRADKLMLGVYVSLLLNMLSTWLLLLGDEEHAARVFKLARTWVPVLTSFVMIFVCVV